MERAKKKLTLPTAIVVVALSATGCGGTAPQATDAGDDAALIADAGPADAACPEGLVWSIAAMSCIPPVV